MPEIIENTRPIQALWLLHRCKGLGSLPESSAEYSGDGGRNAIISVELWRIRGYKEPVECAL